MYKKSHLVHRRFAYEVFYPGNTFVVKQCKDVGSDSMCQGNALSMGTLVWKVSEILLHYWVHTLNIDSET